MATVPTNPDFPNSVTYKAAAKGQSRLVYQVGSSGNSSNPQVLTQGTDTVSGAAVTTQAALLALTGTSNMVSLSIFVQQSSTGVAFKGADGTAATIPQGASLNLAAGAGQIMGPFTITTNSGDVVDLVWQSY